MKQHLELSGFQVGAYIMARWEFGIEVQLGCK